jgi:hypothetical protein
MLNKKTSIETGIFDSEINKLIQVQKDIQKSTKELNKLFKNFSKSKKIDSINNVYKCFHEHVERIDKNIYLIANSMNDIIKNMNMFNNSKLTSLDELTKADHTLGVLTGYELFKLIQYSKILNEDDSNNKRIQYSIERLKDGYNSRGYKLKDFTGEDFVIENNLRVINRIEDKNLKHGKKIISRMIKPTIYYKDVVIKPGEVELSTGPKKEK